VGEKHPGHRGYENKKPLKKEQFPVTRGKRVRGAQKSVRRTSFWGKKSRGAIKTAKSGGNEEGGPDPQASKRKRTRGGGTGSRTNRLAVLGQGH